MKWSAEVAALAALAFLVLGCDGDEGKERKKEKRTSAADEKPTPSDEDGEKENGGGETAKDGVEPVAILSTTQGEITIRFFPKKAPEHVKNFLAHARSGYYEGTYFHRVMQGFMIQGGDPNTKNDDSQDDGQGGYSYKGPGKYLKAEFSDIQHVRGIVSMARSGGKPDSAGSQFFIMVATNKGLDGQYSAFGEVIRGMEVADRIVLEPGEPLSRSGDVRPYKRQFIERIRIEEWPTRKVDETGDANRR
ncbi:MAG: peptidylprolyl isomerase [Planctomycetes bacterium]|nr:peptidylprolyl isomerase [Planctomycetota bacterium]